MATSHQKYNYNAPILIDVISNGWLSITSYKFHNYIQNQLTNNEDFNMAEPQFKYHLLNDITSISMRACSQVYCYLMMHDKFQYNEMLLVCQMTSIIVTLGIIDCIFNYAIENNIELMYSDRTSNLNKVLDLLFGINPFIGICLSTIDSNYSNRTFIYLLLSYVVMITFIKPFQKSNHLAIHFVFIFMNHGLVLNNVN